MYATSVAIFIVCFLTGTARSDPRNVPMAITTWTFKNATLRAWDVLSNNGSALDAIEQGVAVCECEQCDGTVGYGGSPDEDGETTLDALIMNGKTMNVGAVGGLRRVKNAISVARHVLEHTRHSFLVGDQATEFAVQMGFHEESLTTPDSKKMWMEWHNAKNCQPNFWFNVLPDPLKHCGPYSIPPKGGPVCPSTTCMPDTTTSTCQPPKVPVPPPCPAKKGFPCRARRRAAPRPRAPRSASLPIDRFNHDTIGMIAIDRKGNMAAGTSTNGVKFKIPGRIGDSPIPGSGAYVDNEVGGATATGDGDIMLRFLPSFVAVEEMRRGAAPGAAAATAVARVARYHPTFMGAVVAMDRHGNAGAACHGIPAFPYVISDPGNLQEPVQMRTAKCTL
ncbi:N(4)-(Beta-N-acetylglucosaminyl)-L-asparaginase isoform X2 [Plutella xylostella]|uniref:N(4)-(Beta-N-acetylglucosaminyl)-L-asparaginase isoform X2 n=1 Tax=Plutella xylostella TaxID=51655 RepID=UPI002032A871|nr:N(4)-(Beta-N-acetylglucosaminyl)-L-asparaginase isoform X2 [Plutella xylostella]